jgi:cytochrome-b5 reductase
VTNATHNINAQAKALPGQDKDSAETATNLKSTFTGGDQGFISLKLESIENINHNTKKFRFVLPDDDAVSGLHIASALLTKYKGPEMEKPVIRPYTPISDEGN